MRRVFAGVMIAITGCVPIWPETDCEVRGDCADADAGPPPPPDARPPQECEPTTPWPLSFAGVDFGDDLFDVDDDTRVTAVGGAQTIEIRGLRGCPFDAEFDNDVFSVVSTSTTASFVRVRANRPGKAWLRILHPSTDFRYGKIALFAVTADSVQVRRARFQIDDTAPRWVYWRATPQALVLAFYSGGDRLAAEGLTLRAPAGIQKSNDNWDRFDTTSQVAPGDNALEVELRDGTVLTAGLSIVNRVDDLYPVLGWGDTSLPEDGVAIGETRRNCFRAAWGDAAIAGIPFLAQTTGEISATPVDGALCVDLLGLTAGDGELTITAGSRTRTYGVTVSPR